MTKVIGVTFCFLGPQQIVSPPFLFVFFSLFCLSITSNTYNLLALCCMFLFFVIYISSGDIWYEFAKLYGTECAWVYGSCLYYRDFLLLHSSILYRFFARSQALLINVSQSIRSFDFIATYVSISIELVCFLSHSHTCKQSSPFFRRHNLTTVTVKGSGFFSF